MSDIRCWACGAEAETVDITSPADTHKVRAFDRVMRIMAE